MEMNQYISVSYLTQHCIHGCNHSTFYEGKCQKIENNQKIVISIAWNLYMWDVRSISCLKYFVFRNNWDLIEKNIAKLHNEYFYFVFCDYPFSCRKRFGQRFSYQMVFWLKITGCKRLMLRIKRRKQFFSVAYW